MNCRLWRRDPDAFDALTDYDTEPVMIYANG